MKLSENHLLVLTGPELKVWEGRQMICLGRWVGIHVSDDFWSDKSLVFIPEPWDDRNKLSVDYAYLESIHDRLLKSIVKSLNRFHKTNYSERYWTAILDPWLVSYVAVLFDRWERLSRAFEKRDSYIVLTSKESLFHKRPFFSGNEYLNLIQDDSWNHELLVDMLNYAYHDRVVFKNVAHLDFFDKGSKQPPLDLKSKCLQIAKRKIQTYLKLIQKFHSHLCEKFRLIPKVYLHLVGLNFFGNLRFNFALRQYPFYRPYFPDSISGVGNQDHQKNLDSINLQPQSDFERYLERRIVLDMPDEFLGCFKKINDRVKKIPSPKIITSDMDHWYSSYFKHWLAKSIENGSKVIICQHGGSLTQGALFAMNYEERISDSFAIWSSPLHRSHIQLPPVKYFGLSFAYNSGTKIYLSVIGYDAPRYIMRCQINANSGQVYSHYQQIINFYDGLSDKLKCNFRIRPYQDQGWRFPEKYKKFFGSNKVDSLSSYQSFLARSRVVVCTYPETTFSDCIARDIPVILLYPPVFWELHPEMDSLLQLLIKAKIVFRNHKEACNHIAMVWDDPYNWWKSKEVVAVIREYRERALKSDEAFIPSWLDLFGKT